MPACILVVDDDPDLREVVADFLRMKRYDVMLAANGLEALEWIARRVPDLILLDMRMPVMNGWEFARSFRERYGGGCPIVVFTAAADTQARAKEVDAAAWVPKPFEVNQLYAAIDSVLQRARGSEK